MAGFQTIQRAKQLQADLGSRYRELVENHMAPVTAQHETAALMLSLILTATRLLTLLVRMQTQIWCFVPKLNKYPF